MIIQTVSEEDEFLSNAATDTAVKHGELKQTLNGLDLFSIAAGAMISAGIFVLPGLAFKMVGPAVFVSYLLAGALASLGSLATVELATAMPKAGGDYFFVERSMGPMAGSVSGLLSWFAQILKSAFAIFGLAEVIYAAWGINPLLSGMVLTVIFTAVNLYGVKEAAWLQVAMVMALLAILIGFVVGGVPHLSLTAFTPFVSEGRSPTAIITVAAVVFVSYGGLLKISCVAEEVKSPKKTIPRAMVGSIVIVTILYTLVNIILVGTMRPEALADSQTPMADAAGIWFGRAGFAVVSFGAVLAFVTTANAGIMSAARYPMALARDGLLPLWVGHISARRNIPVGAIILTGLITMGSLLMSLEALVTAASAVVLLGYLLTNLSVIILRESRVLNYRPAFRSPLYPWIQVFSIVAFTYLIIQMGFFAVKVCLIAIGLALLAYIIFGRKSGREFALLHLMERITNRRFTDHQLESELREIVNSRDQIIKDEFDHLVEDADVIYLEKEMTSDELFDQVAQSCATDVGLSPNAVKKLLQEREEQSSTVISPLVAIPHIVVEGDSRLKLIIIKDTERIDFSDEDNEDVHAVFLLIGTIDRRNHHLRALAAIAQIIQDYNFEKRWNIAGSPEQLRDVLLLGKRRRNNK